MKFCFPINRRLPDYCEGEVSPDERARITAHLDECARCRERSRQIRQRIDLLRQLPLLDPADELWDGIARDVSASRWPEPGKEAFSGRRLSSGQRRLLRPAAIAAALFIIATALLLVSRFGLLPGAHKGELNLAGYLDLVGTVVTAEPALREFPAAPGFAEAPWPETRAVVSFPVIAPETLPGGYRLTGVRLYTSGDFRALQFKYRSEQGGLCVFQLPSSSELLLGGQPSERCNVEGAYCLLTNSKNCSIYCFVLGETQFAIMMRQTDPAVVGALIRTFNTEYEKTQ